MSFWLIVLWKNVLHDTYYTVGISIMYNNHCSCSKISPSVHVHANSKHVMGSNDKTQDTWYETIGVTPITPIVFQLGTKISSIGAIISIVSVVWFLFLVYYSYVEERRPLLEPYAHYQSTRMGSGFAARASYVRRIAFV